MRSGFVQENRSMSGWGMRGSELGGGSTKLDRSEWVRVEAGGEMTAHR